jgi:FkbM family methyltransferase
MNHLFHILLRKATTLRLTIARCSNWPAIVRAKLGISKGPEVVYFRDGFRLEIIRPLKSTWGEIFEPAIADLYEITRHAPDLVIDVGANIGAFACRAAFLHRKAIIHAFEPFAAHAAILRKNIALNRLENVIIHDYPVTKDGREVVFSRIGSGGSSGIFLQDNRDSAVPLKSITLDRINFANFGSSFIKLDCEGAEGEIIEWICSNLSKLPKNITIACEYHPWCPVPLAQSLAKLKAHGFAAEQKSPFDESYIFASLDRNIRIRRK